AAARAPDRRIRQHGAHPAVGVDLRSADPRLVRDMRRLIAGLALALAAGSACAQAVTRIIVPFAAGGGQDILAPATDSHVGTPLARTVIVETRGGGGGTMGTALVATSPPDGHTLVLAAASHTINGSLHAKLAYDPIRDFSGVAHIGTVEYVLMIHPSIPAKTV